MRVSSLQMQESCMAQKNVLMKKKKHTQQEGTVELVNRTWRDHFGGPLLLVALETDGQEKYG